MVHPDAAGSQLVSSYDVVKLTPVTTFVNDGHLCLPRLSRNTFATAKFDDLFSIRKISPGPGTAIRDSISQLSGDIVRTSVAVPVGGVDVAGRSIPARRES
jgi:hypothetical protein